MSKEKQYTIKPLEWFGSKKAPHLSKNNSREIDGRYSMTPCEGGILLEWTIGLRYSKSWVRPDIESAKKTAERHHLRRIRAYLSEVKKG